MDPFIKYVMLQGDGGSKKVGQGEVCNEHVWHHTYFLFIYVTYKSRTVALKSLGFLGFLKKLKKPKVQFLGFLIYKLEFLLFHVKLCNWSCYYFVTFNIAVH